MYKLCIKWDTFECICSLSFFLGHPVDLTQYSLKCLTQHKVEMCNELGGNMARFTQFPIMITRSTIIYEITSPGAAGSSIYV